MKIPSKALLSLLLVAVIALGYLLTKDNDRGASESANAPAQVNAESGAPEDTSKLLRDEPNNEPNQTSRGTRAGQASGTQLYGDWEPQYMDAHVQLPAGAPQDASLRVLVFSKSKVQYQIHGSAGIARLLADGLGPAAGMSTKDRGQRLAKKDLLASCTVAPDGSFQLPFPAEAEEIWLALDGRYLYLSEVQALSLPANSCELVPVLGAYLGGQVLLPTGPHGPDALGDAAVLIGLDIRLQPDPAQASPSLASSPWAFRRSSEANTETGEFGFRALPTDIVQLVKVNSEVLVNFEQVGLSFKPGKDFQLDVQLSSGIMLSGWVLDPEGEPVENAQVMFADEFSFGAVSNMAATGKTDAEGHFQLMGLGASEGSLMAQSEGFKDSEPLQLTIESGSVWNELELHLQRGAFLSGVIRFPDGSVAAGVRVLVDSDPAAAGGLQALGGMQNNTGEDLTSAQGSFSVQGLGKGPFEISAALLSGAPLPEDLWFARSAGFQPGQADIELVLERTSKLVGHVRNPAGEPVTNFHLRAEFKDSTNVQAALMRRVNSASMDDEDKLNLAGRDLHSMPIEHPEGEFRLEGLTRGVWSITVSAEGYAASPALELNLPTSASAAHVIVMPEEATLAGVVRTPAGEPVEGAIVTLQLGRAEILASMLGQQKTPEARSDAEGRFLLKQLSSGPQFVFAKHDLFAQSEPVPIDPLPGQSLEDISLTLAAGGSLRGLVFGKDGKPADGVQVIIQNQAILVPIMRETMGGGTFLAEHLAPGKYQVTAILDPGKPSGDNAMASMLKNIKFDIVDVVEGQETELILGAAPKDPVRVSGRVTHLGEPVPNAFISFLPEGGKGMADMSIGSSDAQGAYSVEVGSPGDYFITIQILQGGAGQQQQLEHNRTVPKGDAYGMDFELPGARISGQLEGQDGKPLASARVSLSVDSGALAGTMLGGHYAELTTDSEGNYQFDYLDEGSYNVAAGGAAFGGAFGTRSPHGREIQSSIRVGEDEHRSGVDFRLGPSGDITGTVLDAAGKPVSGASIFVRDERGQLLERFTMTATNAAGGFEYMGVAPGNYTVSVLGEGMASRADVGVRVRPGEKASVMVPIDTGTLLIVKLVDKTERPITGIKISIKNEAGHEMSGMFNLASVMDRFNSGFKSEEYQVGPLPPGKYDVFAETSDGRTYRKKVRISNKGRKELRHTAVIR